MQSFFQRRQRPARLALSSTYCDICALLSARASPEAELDQRQMSKNNTKSETREKEAVKNQNPGPQRGLAAIALIVLLFFYKTTVLDVYTNQNKPKDPKELKQKQEQVLQQETKKEEASYVFNEDSEQEQKQIEKIETNPLSTQSDAAVTKTSVAKEGFPTDEVIRKSGRVILRNQDLILDISSLGARVFEAKLPGYKDKLGKDAKTYNLVEHTLGAPFPLGVYAAGQDDSWVNYQLVSFSGATKAGGKYLVDSTEGAVLVFQGNFPDGRIIKKTIGLSPSGYLVDVNVNFLSASTDPRPFEIEWTNYVPELKGSLLDPYNITGYAWYDDSSVDRESFSDFKENKKDLGNVLWASMGGKYFTSALISPEEKTSARAIRTADLHRLRFAAKTSQSGAFKAYLGPKSYNKLESAGYDLEKNVNFGWAGFLSAPLLSLLHVFYAVFKNYGVAIVFLTLLVKLLLFPLTNASFKSMKAMQTMQPEAERIRKTIKDRQKQQQELMALYRKKGVNPLGGCLPMLAQMPVFFGLYSGLIAAVELRHAPFGMWIQDLSTKESLMVAGFSVPVMVILFSLAMLVQQWLTPSNMDPAQKKAMLVMPLVFGFIFANLPAGCVLYSLTNSLISIGQQQALHRNWNSFKTSTIVAVAIFVVALVFSQF